MIEYVVLVDHDDAPLGLQEKQAAHVAGELHRAFSVFIFDRNGRMLLQQRAVTKYHSPGLWSNTCCSHPRPGETPAGGARRRLVEEMGFYCPLHPAFSFIYRADVGGGLIEHEYDHVFIGHFEGAPDPDPAEGGGWRWVTVEQVRTEMLRHPGRFTPWFHIAFDELYERGLLEFAA
jgi:isopentenyl-diphosphate Delta-isomerase